MRTFTRFIACLTIVFIAESFISKWWPNHWIKGGSNRGEFECSLDGEIKHGGIYSVTIKSNADTTTNFETIMQRCKPDGFLGKRVRMSGFVKSKNVAGWAGLWFRIDQDSTMDRLGFDNMQNRPITGTTNWQQYSIVLDVPEKASRLAYGALLSGTGQIWFDDFKFEIVDNSVSTTGDKLKHNGPRAAISAATIETSTPTNLDFEQ